MDKTIDVIKWFYKNNIIINSKTYDGFYKLNMLCYLSKKMFFSLDENSTVILKEFSFKDNKPIFQFITDKYNDLSDFDNINLSNYEVHILKTINRVYGYLDLNFSCLEINNEDMIELYDLYKDEKLDEKFEMINGKYLFIDRNIELTDDEYNSLENIMDNNPTYYVYKDDDGKLMVY